MFGFSVVVDFSLTPALSRREREPIFELFRI